MFTYGFSAPQQVVRVGGKSWVRGSITLLQPRGRRNFVQATRHRAIIESHGLFEPKQDADEVSPQRLEDIARLARQTFGDKLPKEFLSEDEYRVYERLYGPPLEIASEDLSPSSAQELAIEADEELSENVLMREGKDGELEEVAYEEEEHLLQEKEEIVEDLSKADEVDSRAITKTAISETQDDFLARVEEARGAAAVRAAERSAQSELEEVDVGTQVDEIEDESLDSQVVVEVEETSLPKVEDISLEHSDAARTHPLTLAGRSGTSPSTLNIPKDSVVEPVTNLLTDTSNKQISETAHAVFGGSDLPNSTATITRPNLKQQPIGLDAFQHLMKPMEGNAFLVAIMPGAYASITSTLVEVRKRLGAEWLRSLLQQQDGPRILDAGSAGAGVLAWRDVLKAEWQSMHPEGASKEQQPPYGRSTVVTGSDVLRHKASKLLDDTTFIPRLPDYNPARDHPSLERNNPQPRKQYDIIIASYTLWQLKEDYMRKDLIQNLWSLLDSRGGVLILLEKGVPRGFELVAGARETLLKYHVSSPSSENVEYSVDPVSENRFGPKEKAMIIAPCTNHGKCPMYVQAGRSQGRKDYCHFSQRYIRPPYLQHVLSQSHGNHEDIKFSYVAFQRGVDQRQDRGFEQGHAATEAAFKGHASAFEDQSIKQGSSHQPMNPLTFPRTILPPIKRQGHVTMDVCTPSGKIERWTVPRSLSKQAYRDARKSKWGDLWALGAKTRVPSRIRVGRESSGGDPTNMDMSGTGPGSRETTIDAPDSSGLKFKRKGKKPRHKNRLVDDEDG